MKQGLLGPLKAIFKHLNMIRYALQKDNADYNVENGLKEDKTEQ